MHKILATQNYDLQVTERQLKFLLDISAESIISMANMQLCHQSFPCTLDKNVKKTAGKYNAGCRQHK